MTSSPSTSFCSLADEFLNLSPGDCLKDRYVLIESLQSSSDWHIYKAEDRQAKKPVVLKFFKPSSRSKAHHEFHILQKLNSSSSSSSFLLNHSAATSSLFPSECSGSSKHKPPFLPRSVPVPQILDRFDVSYRDEPSTCCLVFDCMGANFGAFLEGSEGLPLVFVGSAIQQVFQHLCLLKKENIMHGELQPSNIVFTNHSTVSVTLVDLANAKEIGNQMEEDDQINKKQEGQTKESKESKWDNYCAPESLFGFEPDYAVDVWSLGCIFYELFMGHPLFCAQSITDLMFQHAYLLGVPSARFLNATKDIRLSFIWHENKWQTHSSLVIEQLNKNSKKNKVFLQQQKHIKKMTLINASISNISSLEHLIRLPQPFVQSNENGNQNAIEMSRVRSKARILSLIKCKGKAAPYFTDHWYRKCDEEFDCDPAMQEQLADLLSRIFVYEPKHRISPQEAAGHSFFALMKLYIEKIENEKFHADTALSL